MTQPLVAAQDSPRLSVQQMMKSPTFIPRRTIKMADQMFLTDAVLRSGDDIPSGFAVYQEAIPLFAADDPQVMDEFGQIPVTAGTIGLPRVARSVRRALAIRVSKTNIDRNEARKVTDQMTQIRNTMVRAWEDALFSALLANPNLQVLTTDTPWGDPDSHIRRDVNSAKYIVRNAALDAGGKQKFGYEADTLIISTEAEFDLFDNDEIEKVYQGNLADQSIRYKGVLPNKFLGLNVVVSWRLDVYAPGAAMVCQRNLVGFISDERKLSWTPMYPLGGGGNGGPEETWRADITRASAIGIDNPKACVLINGVTTGETPPVSGGTIS